MVFMVGHTDYHKIAIGQLHLITPEHTCYEYSFLNGASHVLITGTGHPTGILPHPGHSVQAIGKKSRIKTTREFVPAQVQIRCEVWSVHPCGLLRTDLGAIVLESMGVRHLETAMHIGEGGISSFVR